MKWVPRQELKIIESCQLIATPSFIDSLSTNEQQSCKINDSNTIKSVIQSDRANTA